MLEITETMATEEAPHPSGQHSTSPISTKLNEASDDTPAGLGALAKPDAPDAAIQEMASPTGSSPDPDQTEEEIPAQDSPHPAPGAQADFRPEPESTQDIAYHPLANAFPLIEGDEFEAFCEDIATNGQREPIVMFEGKILDGRNRYRALSSQGIVPQFVEYKGDSPLEFVLSMNMYRRQLTVAQRSIIAAEIVCREASPDNQSEGGNEHLRPGLSLTQAATLLGISERSISSASRVARTGATELLDAVKSGKVKISTAEYVAKLDKDEQADLCAAGAKAVREKAREMREERKRAEKGKGKDDEPTPPATTEASTLSLMPESAKALYHFAQTARLRSDNPAAAADMICRSLVRAGAEETQAIIFATEVASRVRERMVQLALMEPAN